MEFFNHLGVYMGVQFFDFLCFQSYLYIVVDSFTLNYLWIILLVTAIIICNNDSVYTKLYFSFWAKEPQLDYLKGLIKTSWIFIVSNSYYENILSFSFQNAK